MWTCAGQPLTAGMSRAWIFWLRGLSKTLLLVSHVKLLFKGFSLFSFLVLFEHRTLFTLDFVIQKAFRVMIQNLHSEMPVFITHDHKCGRLRGLGEFHSRTRS